MGSFGPDDAVGELSREESVGSESAWYLLEVGIEDRLVGAIIPSCEGKSDSADAGSISSDSCVV